MELEPSRITLKPPTDDRPTMPVPPPVRLVAVEDVHVPAAAGCERELDDFYVTLLRFDREGADHGEITYKAENARLRFDVLEPPITREDFRPIGIDVRSLQTIEKQLIDLEMDYEWQRGISPGHQTILLQDPAGNWVQIGETRIVG